MPDPPPEPTPGPTPGPIREPYSVIVFSFNRGPWLENCVESIERFAPEALLSVRDDASDDPGTLAALERISRRHEVFSSDAPAPGTLKTGGLYPAMQAALDALPDGRLFTFMQDDGQFVRPVERRDMDAIHGYFEASATHGFLGHMFLRGYRRERDAGRWHFDEELGAYVGRTPASDAGWGSHFAAILTSRSDRLRDAGFRFEAREKSNDALAARLFAPRGVLRDPFAADLPLVAFTRHRTSTFATRAIERFDRVEVHRLRGMTPEEVARLRRRDVARVPWAEDFLEPLGTSVPSPWRYGGFQERRWLKHLHRAEVGLRRILPRRPGRGR